MAITQIRSKRRPTGGRYMGTLPKLKERRGSRPTLTKVGDRRAKTSRTRGGGEKERLLRTDKVNLLDPETRKHVVVDLNTILESPANRHFVRRNILTMGAVIETPKGKARVTSRPGQEGTVNATLI